MIDYIKDMIIILLFKDKIIKMYNTITNSILNLFNNKGLDNF